MKKDLQTRYKSFVARYVSSIIDFESGESYNRILRYFVPEFITTLLLYIVPFWLDAYFIASLKSTSLFSTLGATNSLLHFVIKIAEAFSVGTIVLSGRHNGSGDFKEAGRSFRDAFWVNCILGLSVTALLYGGAYWIYGWCVPAEMVADGVPFLRLRAIAILFMFIFLAFVGFFRGVKNSKTPMHIFIAGSVAFLFFDYGLINGTFGLPRLGLYGSAVASIIQYTVMFAVSAVYIMYNEKYRKYGIQLFSIFSDRTYFKDLILLSLPVLLDKATMAFAYIWLLKMIKPLGTCGVASFCMVKDMERIALLPAMAFAQVITFLASNGVGQQDWDGIKSNIKKVLFLSSAFVFAIVFLFSWYPTPVISLFDRQGDFTDITARVFSLLSVLVFFDLLQLVLSGALRGMANVRVVMYARFLICTFYFVPVSYYLSGLAIHDPVIKIALIYGSFYIGNGLMSVIYINHLRSKRWREQAVSQRI